MCIIEVFNVDEVIIFIVYVVKYLYLLKQLIYRS
jgi:hypothetical protein